MISRRAVLPALSVLGGCGRPMTGGYHGSVFVASGQDPSVLVVDLRRFAVRARASLPAPATTLLARGSRVFAVSAEAGSVEVLDAVSLNRLASVRLPGMPVTALIRHDTLWCLLREVPQIVPIDLATLRRRPGLPLPGRPASFDISLSSPVACVSLDGGLIAFADFASGLVHPPRMVEDTIGQIRFRSDGRLALAAGLGERRLIVLDTATRQVMTQLPLALRPERFCMSQDGGQLFITGAGLDAVVIAYPYRTEIAQTSLSGRRPGEMAACSTPPFLFVSNPEAGSVTIFDIASQKAVAVTGVGLEPGPIYITPDEQFAMVLNRASGDMAVIRIPAIRPGRNKTAPLFTMIPVGPRPQAAVISGT